MEKKTLNETKGLILVLNLGSSSLKFSLIDSISLQCIYSGSTKGFNTANAVLEINSDPNEPITKLLNDTGLDHSFLRLVEWMKQNVKQEIVAVGYRIVQGGPQHINPERIDESMLDDLMSFIHLAPNHLPDEIKLIKLFREAYIEIPHFACFDTYFHKNMPAQAKFYPLPEKYKKAGLVRYGFHGISCESVIEQLLEEDVDIKRKKIIIAHLGNGSSVTAIASGISQDTTMGVSPMGGLVMSTRSGDLDPGAILFMMRQDDLSPQQLEEILSKESGLKAIYGNGDIGETTDNITTNHHAAEAFKLYCYQVKKQIAALSAAIGGVDLLIFCGGIGENVPMVRETICTNMEFMGLNINLEANDDGDPIISDVKSKSEIRILKTDEQYVIAMHIQDLINN